MILLTVNKLSRLIMSCDSPILFCSQDEDIEGIRQLLKLGKASLNDIGP